jgi:signal transduction histidine kinase
LQIGSNRESEIGVDGCEGSPTDGNSVAYAGGPVAEEVFPRTVANGGVSELPDEAANQAHLNRPAVDEGLELLALAAVGPGTTLPATTLTDAAHAAAQLPADARLRSIAFTAWVVATAAVEGLPMQPLLDRLAEAVGNYLSLGADTLLVEIHAYAAADPRFTELPPAASVARQLTLAGAFVDSGEITIWRIGASGAVERVAQHAAATDHEVPVVVAAAAIAHAEEQWLPGDELVAGIPISRWQQPVAALVARLPHTPRLGNARTAAAILRATATRLAQVLEREMLLERNAAHDEILTATADRRLARLGFDLHDGPTQDLIVLAGDLERLRRQVSEHGLVDSRIDAAFAELHRRIEATDESLRELAHSLQPQTIVERPLDSLLGRELDRLRERYSIDGTLQVDGDLDDLTATQRITIFRTVQEALTNVREHSCATSAIVTVTVDERSIAVRVEDDGVGFDVANSLESARLRGRMGVVGIGERVRMLGGIFSIDSRTGGPTIVRATLPRWRPPSDASSA